MPPPETHPLEADIEDQHVPSFQPFLADILFSAEAGVEEDKSSQDFLYTLSDTDESEASKGVFERLSAHIPEKPFITGPHESAFGFDEFFLKTYLPTENGGPKPMETNSEELINQAEQPIPPTEKDNTIKALLNSANAFFEQGKLSTTAELLWECYKLNPSNEEVKLLTRRTYLKECEINLKLHLLFKKFQSGMEVIKYIFSELFDSLLADEIVMIALSSILILKKNNHYAGISEISTLLINHTQDNTQYYIYRSVSSLLIKDYLTAINDATMIINQPNLEAIKKFEMYYVRGKSCLALKQYESSIHDALEMQKLSNNENIDALGILILSYISQNLYKQATPYIKTLKQLISKEDHPLFLEICETLETNFHNPEIQQDLRHKLNIIQLQLMLQPKNPKFHASHVEITYEFSKKEEEILREKKYTNPDEEKKVKLELLNAYRFLYGYYVGVYKFLRAEEFLKKIIQLEPDNKKNVFSLIIIYVFLGKYVDVVNQMDKLFLSECSSDVDLINNAKKIIGTHPQFEFFLDKRNYTDFAYIYCRVPFKPNLFTMILPKKTELLTSISDRPTDIKFYTEITVGRIIVMLLRYLSKLFPSDPADCTKKSDPFPGVDENAAQSTVINFLLSRIVIDNTNISVITLFYLLMNPKKRVSFMSIIDRLIYYKKFLQNIFFFDRYSSQHTLSMLMAMHHESIPFLLNWMTTGFLNEKSFVFHHLLICNNSLRNLPVLIAFNAKQAIDIITLVQWLFNNVLPVVSNLFFMLILTDNRDSSECHKNEKIGTLITLIVSRLVEFMHNPESNIKSSMNALLLYFFSDAAREFFKLSPEKILALLFKKDRFNMSFFLYVVQYLNHENLIIPCLKFLESMKPLLGNNIQKLFLQSIPGTNETFLSLLIKAIKVHKIQITAPKELKKFFPDPKLIELAPALPSNTSNRPGFNS